MKTNLKIYVAGGWFSTSQAESVSEIERAVEYNMFEMYSPRKDALWTPGMDHKLIVAENTAAIDDCSFVVASTEGKDMGTLWECGYAYAQSIPVVYYFKGTGNFNIMLAATGICVCTSYNDLNTYLSLVRARGLVEIAYKGAME